MGETKREGFTLLEVIVSLALIGLITVTILPWFGHSFQKLSQATEILNNDYSAQDIIAKVRLDTGYPSDLEAKELAFKVKKESMYYFLDDSGTIKYVKKNEASDEIASKSEEGLQLTLIDKKSDSVFLTTFIRLKKLQLKVSVLDTSKEFKGSGIEGVHLGLYKTLYREDNPLSDVRGHELVELQTTDSEGKVFFHLPGDYNSSRYVVMFPDDNQYQAFYEYDRHYINGRYYSYKKSYRQDMSTAVGSLSRLKSEGLDSIWGNSSSVHIKNKSSNSGRIICERLQVNSKEYIFDSDTCIGARGNTRNNFDEGNDDFSGRVNVENGRAKEIRYILRQPVNLEIYSSRGIREFWITNYNHRDGTNTGNRVTIPYLWPRIKKYDEYPYLSEINSGYNLNNEIVVYDKLFDYTDNGYVFKSSDNRPDAGSISYDGKTWGYSSVYWNIKN